MDLHVSLEGRKDLAGQIYRQLRAAILDGRLRAGEALPPTRELARRLEISRNTVAVAYDRLTAEGFLDGRVGAGTFVQEAGPVSRGAPEASPLRPRPIWDEITVWPAWTPGVRWDFRVGVPDVRLFPYESWRRIMAGRLRPSALDDPAAAGDPAGLLDLRRAIARHVGVSRSVRAGAGDVVVTSGIQQALDLIVRVLLEPGDVVAVEDPGYPPARLLLTAAGMRVRGVPVDAEGLRVDALPEDARAVYVTPSHQFPLGMPMSLPRRRALLDWARRRDVVVVEDDYDTEYRYAGRPIEPLQSLDEDGRVLYMGTFSKIMRPVLRLGFLVAPPSLHRAFRMARYVSSWHADMPTQAALARFIDEGLLARHLRRSRREYQARHERITELVGAASGSGLTVIPSVAGLHLSATLPDGTDDAALARRALAEGIGLFALSEFAVTGRGGPGLVLGYGAVTLPEIDAGFGRLREVIAGRV
ncbi:MULTISPECIES: PLP-dependent aminotransferase family protein [Actinomadura]|uniref:Aminotransferase class I/II-fold pyridoxal phosphate-dependent enzyme n=1 Tax=Actinomadura litoris TaxID=2678616 RepID=A0A7K1L7F0_9ACTN|nr:MULTISPECIES: PLP-dependent aminotransferase family protein [Actinomadura]MBT2209505.1 PLP-dependent aminotransferase family protein [Actinomadura sp. NEAU-AAG7]MUN40196.1 aminotransferase class I/II-fold pyridoxal phosphate-dependent enzyme [Actinomadura litoris]